MRKLIRNIAVVDNNLSRDVADGGARGENQHSPFTLVFISFPRVGEVEHTWCYGTLGSGINERTNDKSSLL